MSIHPDHSGKQDATAGCFSKFVLPPNHPNSHDWKLPIKAVWFESWEKSITFPSNKQFAPENWPGQKERIVSNRWFSMLVFGRVHRTMLAKLAAAAIPPFTEGNPTPKKCCFHALFFFQLFCWRPKNIQCPNDGNIVFHSFKNSPELCSFLFFCFVEISLGEVPWSSLPSHQQRHRKPGRLRIGFQHLNPASPRTGVPKTFRTKTAWLPRSCPKLVACKLLPEV